MRKIWSAAALLLLCANGYGSDYGTTGLIDIPTARMRADGALTTTAATQSRTNAYSITYQATPWFEGTFRYTGYNEFFFYDRNYEGKLRLWEEQPYLPQVAIGIRDMVGTGIAGAEYLVASKAFSNLDVTLGMGWGRLAGSGLISNPLKAVSDDFASRDFDFGKGGEVSYQQFFSGEDVGLFGGVSYQFTAFPVKLMAEYNPDQYTFEVSQGGRAPGSAWSAAASWEFSPDVFVTLSRQHNDEWGLQLSASLDSVSLPAKPPIEYIKSSLDMTQDELPLGLNPQSWYDNLLYDMERSGLQLIEANIDRDTRSANLVVGNKSFSLWADAVARAIRLANVHLPSSVQSINIVIEDKGHRVHTLRTSRPSRAIKVVTRSYDKKSFAKQIDLLPGRSLSVVEKRTGFVTNKINFDVSLANRLQLFDPDDPARYQIYVKLGASLRLPKSWILRGTWGQDIYNNFGDIDRVSDSVLPRVRSDVASYLSEGDSGLDALYLEKRGSWQRELHFRVFGGVLEEMYSGIGGEMLLQPHGSRLAFGVSANWVKQRAFDKSFDHFDYQTTTAFVSAYWATPFYNYDVAIHAGRYLAKDIGATLEVRRTFDNGWMVGLWATLTDVPFDDFGEGSFDKGMFFRVPLDGFGGRRTRAAYENRLRPIQRDGGQRLEGFSGNLWFDMRASRYDALDNQRQRMAP
jgi:hypothetical protein